MDGLERTAVEDALAGVYGKVSQAADELTEAAALLPTRCAGWAVLDVLYHQGRCHLRTQRHGRLPITPADRSALGPLAGKLPLFGGQARPRASLVLPAGAKISESGRHRPSRRRLWAYLLLPDPSTVREYQMRGLDRAVMIGHAR